MKTNKGFTLTEILIVVAIVSILAAIAIPNYQESVRKSARQVGKNILYEVMGRQEQFFVNTKQYATDLTDLGFSANGFYIDKEGQEATSSGERIYLIQFAAATASSFTLNAVPQNGQVYDSDCATLSVTNTGAKSATGSKGIECW